MLLIHDKDFFLNDSIRVEYTCTFKQNLVEVVDYIPQNKRNFCGVIDLIDDP